MRTSFSVLILAVVIPIALAIVAPARAANEISCRMTLSLAGWSAFYKTASGNGEVHCSNGQTMRVHLSSKGGGLTFGKSEITGTGKFSGIYDIREILGDYVNAEAHAGAVRSSRGTVMTKGNVSLALSGTGSGWNLGVDFGKFTISAD